jgi:thiosulfate oxidation carrier complex protein SoxZ
VRGLTVNDIGKIRIRVPSSVKPGDVVRVRCLVIHPMERIERDAQGKIVDRNYNYITRVTATYLGKPVVAFDLTQSVSENPAFSFALKATAPGPVKVTFVDTHGGKYEGAADIAFA